MSHILVSGLVWAIQANGVGGFLKELFGPKVRRPIVKILMIVIFFAVAGSK